MKPKTLKALKGSIAKWEAIVAGTGIDSGHLNCPLCALFWDRSCRGCPVMEKTGKDSCSDTPYDAYREKESLRAAKKELAFLKSLLPTLTSTERR